MNKIKLLFLVILVFCFTQNLLSQLFVEQNSGVTVNLTSVSMYQTTWSVPYQAWVCGNNGTVLRTSNTGTNWLNVSGGGIPNTVNLVNIWCIDSVNILTAGNIGSVTYVYRTSNKGASWSQVFTQANGNINAIWMSSAAQGFMVGNPAGGRWSLWKTTNGGSNWDSTGLYLSQAGAEIGWNNALSIKNNRIWFGTNNTRIYYSTNFGSNWQTLSTAPEVNSTSVLFYWNDSTYGYFGGANSYKTTNYGFNWTLISHPGSGNFGGFTNGIAAVFNHYPPMLDFAVKGDSIFYNFSMGNWNSIYCAPSGVYRHVAPFYQPTGQYYYSWAVRSNGGITRLVTMWGGVKKISSSVPDKYSLQQNYPNPFNPSTKFKIQIAKLSNVKVSVFDVLGKKVATLVNEQLKPGSYEVEWDGSNYPSGVYFYKLISGDFVETKKMVLMK